MQITEGLSSFVSADTMLTEMFESGFDMNKELVILSFCDFDPAGSSIPIHFCEHLKSLGFTNVRKFEQYGNATTYRKQKNGKRKKLSQIRPCLDIISPKDLLVKERNRIAHKLDSKIINDDRTLNWAFETGGITGTGKNAKMGISSEMLLGYVDERVDTIMKELRAKPSDKFGRKLNYSYLHGAIREYIGARVERGA